MDLRLTNERALVLASSSGLGRAIALELAREGARVVLNSRSQERADAAARAVRDGTGADTYGVAADVSSDADLSRLVGRAVDHLGGLDILVTNAGGPPVGNFRSLDAEQWQAAHELTLNSVVRSIRHSLPHLREGGGAVLSVASSSVVRPIPNLILSNVYRPAIRALGKSLALELADDGIRVNTLLPGRIHTDRVDSLDQERAERTGRTLDQVRSETLARIPLGRLGRTEELARVAAFLVSDAASYVTGQSILCDGGMVDCL